MKNNLFSIKNQRYRYWQQRSHIKKSETKVIQKQHGDIDSLPYQEKWKNGWKRSIQEHRGEPVLVKEIQKKRKFKEELKKQDPLFQLKEKKQKGTPSYHITKSIDCVRPVLNVKRVRRGRRTFYIPFSFERESARIKAIKWMKEGCQKNRKGKNQSFGRSFGSVLLDSMNGTGYAQKKQKEFHKLAIQNKSSYRFRWW